MNTYRIGDYAMNFGELVRVIGFHQVTNEPLVQIVSGASKGQRYYANAQFMERTN